MSGKDLIFINMAAKAATEAEAGVSEGKVQARRSRGAELRASGKRRIKELKGKPMS